MVLRQPGLGLFDDLGDGFGGPGGAAGDVVAFETLGKTHPVGDEASVGDGGAAVSQRGQPFRQSVDGRHQALVEAAQSSKADAASICLDKISRISPSSI